jgi:hypothetical protein
VSRALLQHLHHGVLRDVEEASEIGRDLCPEVVDRIVREGLGDEDPGIVDERVDPPEPRHRLFDDALGRCRIADVAGYGSSIVIAAQLDRARRRHYPVIAIAISLDQCSADTLRGASDNDDFLLCAHSKTSGWSTGKLDDDYVGVD